MNHPKLEIVTSIYKDRDKLARWQQGVKDIPLTVYNKIDNLEYRYSTLPDLMWNNYTQYELANYGRCDYAFLWHIVENWDALADTTVFVKNNWQDTGNDLHKVIENAPYYDFVENGMPRKIQKLRKIGGKYGPDFESYKDLEIEDRSVNIHIYKAEGILEWANYLYKDPPNCWVGSVHGPCFSVSRELIKQHDISVYRYLLSRFYPESKSWNQKLANEKCGLDTIEKQIVDSGRHFHDELLRFWTCLFCNHDNYVSNRKGLYIHV